MSCDKICQFIVVRFNSCYSPLQKNVIKINMGRTVHKTAAQTVQDQARNVTALLENVSRAVMMATKEINVNTVRK